MLCWYCIVYTSCICPDTISTYLQVSKRDHKGQGGKTGKGRGKNEIQKKRGKEGGAAKGGNGGRHLDLSSMLSGALVSGR